MKIICSLYTLIFILYCNAQEHSKSHAVIISGGLNIDNNHSRYYRNTQSMFKAFKKYGFADENIRTLYGDGGFKGEDSYAIDPKTMIRIAYNPSFDLDNDGKRDIKYSASPEGINNAFINLRKQTHAGDNVIIFITDHGNTDGHVVLWNNQYWNITDMKKELSQFDKEVNIQIVTNMCYGGKLMELTNEHTCVISNADKNNSSFSDIDKDTFTDSIAEAMSNKKTISLKNIFDIGRKNDHPQNITHTNSLAYFLENNVNKNILTQKYTCESHASPIKTLSHFSQKINETLQNYPIANIDPQRKSSLLEAENKQKKINEEIQKLSNSWTENNWNKINNQYNLLTEKWNNSTKEEKNKIRGQLTQQVEALNNETNKQKKIILSLQQDLMTLEKEIIFLKTANTEKFEMYKKIKGCLNREI